MRNYMTALTLALISATTALGQSFLLLPPPPGSDGTFGTAISRNGDRVTGVTDPQPPFFTYGAPVTWNAATGDPMPIGTLPDMLATQPLSVANTGAIAGVAQQATSLRAFRWSAANGTEYIPVGDGITPEFAYGSADGTTIAGTGSTAGGEQRAYWFRDGVGTVELPLPAPPSGFDFITVADVTADGSQIVGSFNETPVIWTNGAVDTLTVPNGYAGALPAAISADGAFIAGRALPSDPSAMTEPLRWVNGVPELLNVPGFWPSAINDTGDTIVGFSELTFGAVIWRDEIGAMSLDEFAANELGLDLGDWVLGQFLDMSDDGTRIAGTAFNLTNGAQQGFVLTIPEPTTAVTLVVLALLSLRRR